MTRTGIDEGKLSKVDSDFEKAKKGIPVEKISTQVPDFISCIFITDNRKLEAGGSDRGSPDE